MDEGEEYISDDSGKLNPTAPKKHRVDPELQNPQPPIDDELMDDGDNEDDEEYEEFKNLARQEEGYTQEDFFKLFHNTNPRQFANILKIGKANNAFDSVWPDTDYDDSDPYTEKLYKSLGGLLFDDELFGHPFDFYSEEADKELSAQLKTLFDHWPFPESSSTLLKYPGDSSLTATDETGEISYNGYDDIFATFIAKHMPESLKIVLMAIPEPERYALRCIASLEDAEEEEPITYVEVALHAQSYDCLAVLLELGFDPSCELYFYDLEELDDESQKLFEDYKLIHSINSVNEAESTKKILGSLSRTLIEKLKNPSESLDWLDSFLLQEDADSIQKGLQKKVLLDAHRIIQNLTGKDEANIDNNLLTSKKNIADPSYMYIEGTFYKLPSASSEELLINILVTKLLYRSSRYHGLDLKTIISLDPKNEIIFKILCKLNKIFENHSLEDFRIFIEKKETEKHDFFGDDLSDDSDDERKKEYDKWDDRQKLSTRQYARHLIFKTKLNEVVKKSKKKETNEAAPEIPKLKDYISRHKRDPKKGEAILDEDGRPKFKPFDALSPFERQKLFGSTELTEENFYQFPALLKSKVNTIEELELQKQHDLSVVNYYMAKGEVDKLQKLINEGKIKTKFMVCQYRGVHYNTATWTAKKRRENRKLNEKGMSLFSSSVLNRQGNEAEAKTQAQKILEFKNHSAPNIQSLFRELQSFYTNYYDNFHELMRYAVSLPPLTETAWRTTLKGKKEIAKQIENFSLIQSTIQTYFSDPNNPFVSTGDLPFHGLRYAYGLKSYPGHKDERLRPRWNNAGQAERPYSGKFYVNAYSLEKYLEQPSNHVFSMHTTGEITALSTNKAERETSFFAYQPEKSLVYQHVAKYPSFTGEFHPLFEHKYGLSEPLYNLFKKTFEESPPHSPENWNAKLVLGEILCAYQEAMILDYARNYALDQGAVLIYRGPLGTFEFSPSNIHADAEKDLEKPNKGWAKTFNDFIATRKNVFKNQPKKDLIDALLCEDIKRVEELLQKIQTTEELTEIVQIPEYKTEAGDPPKSYSAINIATSKQGRLVEKMVSAKQKELLAVQNDIRPGF